MADFWNLPIGARPDPLAYDELGNPVLRDYAGRAYTSQPETSVYPQWLQDSTAAMNPQGLGINDRRPGRGEQALAGLSALSQHPVQGLLAAVPDPMGPNTYGDVMGAAIGLLGGGAAGVVPEGALAANSFRAYHGSPHAFDRFSLDAIGSGEGAQAFGHGLYFADSEDVARFYRDGLSRQVTIDGQAPALASMDGPLGAAQATIVRYVAEGTPPRDAIARAAAEWREQAAMYRAYANDPDMGQEAAAQADDFDRVAAAVEAQDPSVYVKNPGSMYEVQVNADPETFLDWDAPLSRQPEPVQRALMNHPEAHRFDPEWTGAQLYESSRLVPGQHADPKAASSALRDLGVPGVRYHDAGSRHATQASGTRNSVVFDDRLVEILRRYGLAGAAPAAGLLASRDGNGGT